MPKQSSGILLYRIGTTGLEVLLVHPGGSFFTRKDNGAWSVPKGEFEDDEDVLVAAKREFSEELGVKAPEDSEYLDLGSVKSKSGKTNFIFAVKGDFDATTLKSNTFELEWPPKSSQLQTFPEVDKAMWFDMAKAKIKLNAAQAELIDRLVEKLGLEPLPEPPQQAALF